jgi:hypothetical protein
MFHAVPVLRRPLSAAPVAALVALFLAASPSVAAIHAVTDMGDTGALGQLRTVIASAVSGDSISVPAGTILLAAGQLLIDKDLVILGAGREFTVIDAGTASRVLKIAGGVRVTLAGMTLRNGLPAAGTGLTGGGIQNEGVLDLVGVLVQGCSAEGGGGIWNHTGATLNLQAVTVRANTTFGLTPIGAGIGNWGTLSIANTTISGNEATGTSSSANGAGIHSSGSLAIVNSTITGNRAAANLGGGIYLSPLAGATSLVNVTIAGNEARRFGGGLAMGRDAVVTLANTLIASNRVVERDGHPDCSGAVTSLGHNLVGRSSGCVVGGDLTGNILDRFAWLAPLGDNGGPTQTHALWPRSPAIDAGDDALAPAFDQRGAPRGAPPDIGAYERIR